MKEINLEEKNGLIGCLIKRKVKQIWMEQKIRKSKSFLLNDMDFCYQRKRKLTYYYNNHRPSLMTIHKRIAKYIKLDKPSCLFQQKIYRFYKFSQRRNTKYEQFVIDYKVYNIKNQERNLNDLDAVEVPFDLYMFDYDEAPFEQQQIDVEEYNVENQRLARQNNKIMNSNNH
ncbi:unnamed protein product [Paramecium octaurelia]|uniref:Uncharacterized protein n=1 Tax=Paramecium octaurelia TaxID=43137 RepID=A0A8S1TVN9_PAROT|nr:unnamed protein product [Paramecium octaurelia]